MPSGSKEGKIPKIIYQSYRDSNLPLSYRDNSLLLQKLNPGYRYEFFDDQRCREFLLEVFGPVHAKAFDDLVPGAFKCDLWRYAMLYTTGGIYLDLDIAPLVSLSEVITSELTFISACDRRIFHFPKCALYQAFLGCEPGHPAVKLALDMSLQNVINRKPNTKETVLDITGPVVMGRAMNQWLGRPEEAELFPGESIRGKQKIKLLRFDDDGRWVSSSSGRKIFSTVTNFSPPDYYTRTRTYRE